LNQTWKMMKSCVKNREIKCRYSVCIAGLEINCQDNVGTAPIAISPFKTDVPKQPQPPFTLTLLLVAITREQNVSNLLASTAGLRSHGKNDTSSAPELFFHEHGSSSGAHGFHVCGSCSGAVAILEFKKCGSHFRTKAKVRIKHKFLTYMVTFRCNEH